MSCPVEIQIFIIFHQSYARKFLTKGQKPNVNLPKRVLSYEEKFEFVRTTVSWISSKRKDIMDTCFILNFGYEAPLPWPQV